MDKPVVFISHITEEREMALEFKKLISDSFLNMFEVFVSSDDGSVSGGSKWMNEISKALEKSNKEEIICLFLENPKLVGLWMKSDAMSQTI